ncbi:hypothetical protein BKA56DRAFT_672405 [Ilyonectria sp. MPI-CAGE-AT-0026]|nr:hypothetical protein BKA56DRAFT_672405 [Ilyonectria sp. MPI-CAGE-AT-0026]
MCPHSIPNARTIDAATPSPDDTTNSYTQHDQGDNNAGENHAGDNHAGDNHTDENDSPFLENVQTRQSQDTETDTETEPPDGDEQNEWSPSTRRPSLKESLKRVWATNTLIRLTLEATLAALCLCSIVAPILPRSAHGLVPSGVYVYYEPLALYDDIIAMAETHATAAYPLLQSDDYELFDRLADDARALCGELYSRADMWTPDGGPVVTKRYRDFADFDEDVGVDTFEQGDVDVHALCDYIQGTITRSRSLYWEGLELFAWRLDSIEFLWGLGDVLGRGIEENKASRADSKAWPWTYLTTVRRRFDSLRVKIKELSLWFADSNQPKTVQAIRDLLTSNTSFAAGTPKISFLADESSTEARAHLSSLKTKLLDADKAIGKLYHIAEDVVVRSVAAAAVPSGYLRTVSRDEARMMGEIKNLSQAALRVRGARVHVSGLLAKLDALTAMRDAVLGCEAAWTQLIGELISASDMPPGVALPGSRYVWTESGWMTRRSRGERGRPNSSKSIGICADLKERLRNLPGRHDKPDDVNEVDDVDAYDHNDQDMADAVVLFMPDPAIVLPLAFESWQNCAWLRRRPRNNTEYDD